MARHPIVEKVMRTDLRQLQRQRDSALNGAAQASDNRQRHDLEMYAQRRNVEIAAQEKLMGARHG